MRDGNLKPWLKISFLLFFCALNGAVLGQAPLDHVPGEIIVKLKADLSSNTNISIFSSDGSQARSIKEILPQLKEYNVSSVQKIFPAGGVRSMADDTAPSSLDNIYRISLPEDTDTAPILKALESDPEVEYASLNHLVKFCLVPNDPYLNTSGSWGNSHRDAWGLYKIQADKAWDITTGSREIVVAVIDTGVDYEHEELKGRVIKGYDFSDRDDDPMDPDGHGTHVAGILAAAGNNGRGIAGMAWNCRILAIKIYPYGTEADCAQAIRYAADHVSGVRVISMSWHLIGTSSSPLLENAIEYAARRDIVMVASAGNEKSDVASYVPANHPEVMAVSSTDVDDKICPFSNRGNKIDVAAPGGGWGTLGGTYNVLSLKSRNAPDEYDSFIVGGDYLRLGGTSMAAAYVSGLAALMLSKNPYLTKGEVESKIRFSTDDLGAPGFDEEYGYGRINTLAALEMVPSPTGGIGGEPPGESIEIEKIDPPDWVKALRVGDMALDDKGNMYVVYTNQHRVIKYKLAPSGRIEDSTPLCSTAVFSGDGDSLHYPMAVAVSPSGDRVYVADTYKLRVLMYDMDLNPVGELKGGNIYKMERTHKYFYYWPVIRVREVRGGPEVIGNAGAGEHFFLPVSIGVSNGGEVYVVDKDGHRVFRYDKDLEGKIFSNVVLNATSERELEEWKKKYDTGSKELGETIPDLVVKFFDNWAKATFNWLGGEEDTFELTFRSNAINDLIYPHPDYSVTGSKHLIPGRGFGPQDGRLSFPEAGQIGPSGFLYIADTGNNRVQKFDSDGRFVVAFGKETLNAPRGIDIDAYGNVFVADTGNKRIVKFDAAGNFIDEYKPFNLRFAGGR